MSDRLILSAIEADCRLGVYAWEQQAAQPVWIDLELGIAAARAAAGDSVEDAVDYAALVTAVREVAEGRAFHLLETLAEAIAAAVLAQGATSWVRVRVKKRALKRIGYAAVEIERRARQQPRRAGTSRRSSRSPTASRR